MNVKKKIVVIGGGFAGIQFCRTIDTRRFEVLLMDKLNHHQFQPLFYQVATSQLEPSSISFPLRNIFNAGSGIQVQVAEVTEIQTAAQTIQTNWGPVAYDYLVLANGCKTNFFGNTELEQGAFTLKTTSDAIAIRNHVLKVFEQIASTKAAERSALLNLVIVGGGPTGVELAGSFAEIRENVLPRDYPGVDFSELNIHLIEGSPNTLNSMSEVAREASRNYLEAMGVLVQTGVVVKSYDGETALLSNDQKIVTKTLIWAAGVTANFIPGLPEACKAPGNRIAVDRYNRVLGLEQVFAVGDVAWMSTPKYPKGHPQLANVAINQAKLLAKNLVQLEKHQAMKEFEYRDLGAMATIGKHKAVVDLPFVRFKGYFAWFLWMFLHLMLILSVKNKLFIFINWAWNYFTTDSSLRLILEPTRKKRPDS